ncbi:two-component system activity regulator YycH [Tindallia californiensis]|uniref:YycH protein n=1 Tax=Tindallia californiensis TaxID=159292 RepID=A0A1H3QII8_9FIRM|nr:two-component system activity regulator YycH [Tindallia californiensis]SDZ13110.1 YycH protein [Tindallia californiensis]
MNKEKLKSLLLVFLIITSIMLTQRVWFRSPLELLQTEASYFEVSEELLEETRRAVLQPDRLVLGFGGGVNNSHHTHIDHRNLPPYWEAGKKLLAHFFTQELDVQVVPEETYFQAFSARNLEFHFGQGMPASLPAAMFGSMDNDITQNLHSIQKILIPAREQQTIYLMDAEGTYYQLTLEDMPEEIPWPDFVTMLEEKSFSSYVKYYPLFTYVENDVLLPLSYEKNVPRIFVESTMDTGNESRLHEKVRSFFDENFDFVKMIRETTGSHIYMYGYGQQEVRVSKTGRLEYTAETGNESGTNLNRAFNIALEFILRNEGFPEGAYLQEVTPIEENGNRGFRFAFGYHIQGFSVEQKRQNLSSPIIIEVFGDSVSRYRAMTRQVMGMPEVRPEGGIISPHRLIEDHFNALLEDLENRIVLEKDETGEEEERGQENTISGDELLRRIEDVVLVYWDRKDTHRRQMLIPAWRMTIDGEKYYFDAHEGIWLNREP